MNNLYDLINISNVYVEYLIKKSILETNEYLKNTPKELTCKIYSAVVYERLRKNHVICKVINSKDLGADYEHHFVLIPKDDTYYYLVDLVYKQFNESKLFPKLISDGYQEINSIDFTNYFNIISGNCKISYLDDVYYNHKR